MLGPQIKMQVTAPDPHPFPTPKGAREHLDLPIFESMNHRLPHLAPLSINAVVILRSRMRAST